MPFTRPGLVIKLILEFKGILNSASHAMAAACAPMHVFLGCLIPVLIQLSFQASGYCSHIHQSDSLKVVSVANVHYANSPAVFRKNVTPHSFHYLPLDSILQIPILIYLFWAFWVQNWTTFVSDNRYFEIQT